MKKIAIVVFDEAQILDVAGPMEVLRGATLAVRERRAQVAPAYEVRIVAREAGAVRTSCGLTILATDSFATAPRARRVVATGTGTFVLATAGLLDGHRATTHWRACKSLAQLFPRIRVEPNHVFVRDGKFLTSAGASAALDQSLALVQEDFGKDIAMSVAHRKVMFLRRTGGESQVSSHLAAQMTGHEGLAALATWILANTAKEITAEMLAQQSAMSARTLSRLFSRELGMTPAGFIERARVEVARRLLEESDMRIDTIARKSGLGSEERMWRAFQWAFGLTPREYHDRFHEGPAIAENWPLLVERPAPA